MNRSNESLQSLDSNIAMIVPSCDAFADIAKIFFDYQKKFMPWWDKNKYYVIENNDITFDDVITIKTGNDVNWTYRMRRALEIIDEDYLLFLLDDYFIGNPVSEELIIKAYDVMRKENLRYYKFNNKPMVRGINSQYKDYNHLFTIPNNIRYGIVLGEGIYRKDFFSEMLGSEDKSIWRVETDRLVGLEEMDGSVIDGCVIDNRNILLTYNGVLKGKWIPATLKHFKNIGMPINIGTRGIMKRSACLIRSACGLADKYLSSNQIKSVKKIMSKLGVKFVTPN